MSDAWSILSLEITRHQTSGAAWDLASLWPLVERWFSFESQGVPPERDWLSVQVGYGSSDGALSGPAPHEALLGEGEWFSVTLERDPGVPELGPLGLELWFEPSTALLALTGCDHWDSENLFGLDCVGIASRSDRLLESPTVQRIRAAADSTEPAAVLIYGGSLDEPVVLHPDPPGASFRFSD